MMRHKDSDRLRVSFEAYVRWWTLWCKQWHRAPVHPYCEHKDNGPDALTTFRRIENGQTALTCRQPRLLTKAVDGKGFLNQQIKMWAAGCAEWSTWISELVDDFPWLPEWVWKAVARQADRASGMKSFYRLPYRVLCVEVPN